MNKRVLQAFSAGIFTSTSILTLTFYLGGYHKPAVVENKITESDVESYLLENEQIAISKKDYEEYTKLRESASTKQNMTKQKEESSDSKQNNKPAEEKPKEEPKSKSTTITIKEGMTTSDVSKLLESAGIIKSSSEFNKYLIEHDYHTRVQIGTFKVQEDMSFYELAEAITR